MAHVTFGPDSERPEGEEPDPVSLRVVRGEGPDPVSTGGHATLKILNMNQLDLKNLQNLCKFEFHKHRLSHERLKFYQFYAFDLPVAIITLITGILAFLAGSSISDTNNTTNTDATIDAESRQILALTVGALAVVSVFMQKLAGSFKYGSRSDMHHAASMDLKHMIDELKFQILAVQVAKHSGAKEYVGVPFEAYQIRFGQILEGNKSLIPLRISSAFDLCIEELNLKFVVPDTRAAIIIGAVIVEVSTQIANFTWWPLRHIHSEQLVHAAIKKIEALVDKGTFKEMNTIDAVNPRYDLNLTSV